MTEWDEIAERLESNSAADPRDALIEQMADAVEALTPEGYVAAFIANGENSPFPRAKWEDPYQDAGVIEEAQKRGYIRIDSDVACTVTVTPHGRTAAELHHARAALSATPDPRDVLIERLVEAVRPFTRYADELAAVHAHNNDAREIIGFNNLLLMLGDFRRATGALAAARKAGYGAR